MKILMLTGSPNQQGTTALLADKFCEGAEANHEVARFNAAKMNIHHCEGCRLCRKNNSVCAFKDDMTAVYPRLLSAGMIVFVTPLYYFHMTSQLKKTLDRFYAIHRELRGAKKKAALIASCGNKSEWAMDAVTSHFNIICQYLQWEPSGTVLASGCFSREDCENSPFPEEARLLGAGL